MPLPETERSGSLQAELLARGIRMTRQRRVIVGIIETATRHLDVSQILRKAKRIDPRIDRVTVYRTVTLLKRQGLIDELDLMHLNGVGHFYERRPSRDHLHMTCVRCGTIIEFETPLFEKMKQQVERDCRFHVTVARMEIGGYCHKCRT